jgi:hypothetical protein
MWTVGLASGEWTIANRDGTIIARLKDRTTAETIAAEHNRIGRKIFMVTSGCYSDRRVEELFSTREMADAFSQMTRESNGVEEWDVDALDPVEYRGLNKWEVEMDMDGDVLSVTDLGAETPEVARYHEYKDNVGRIRGRCYCFAKDRQHAVKSSNEQRAMFIASGLRK